MKQSRRRKSSRETAARLEVPEYDARVVVKFCDDIALPYDDSVEQHLDRLPGRVWQKLKEQFPGISIRVLFNAVTPTRIRQLVDEAVRQDEIYRPPNFLSYFVIDFPAEVNEEQLVSELSRWKLVQTAYFDPPGENPSTSPDDPRMGNQGYLNPAPDGIDAKYARGFLGGDGAGQQVIDLEKGWTLDHEDLIAHGANLLYGSIVDTSRPHGTSVLGVICATANKVGGVGIAPEVASVNVVSHSGIKSTIPGAILAAIDKLPDGGVLLLEVQRLWLPTETMLADFDMIGLAIARGVTVVEAAGNGGFDLDNFKDAEGYRVLNRGDSAFRDSGAIMVAAASSTVKHERMNLSNFGSRIDCYAWGENVDCPTSTITTPFSKMQYTRTFQGTSSAAAIIAGAALLAQGMARAGRGPLNPQQMRDLLRNPATGTESKNPATEWIGVMPDFLKIISSNALGSVPTV